MKFKILFLVFISLFLIGCNQNRDKTEVDVFSKNLITYSEGDAQDRVTKNFDLTLEIEGININWRSADTTIIQIIKEKAIVTRRESDEFITLTASYTDGVDELSKKFIIVVKGTGNGETGDTTPPVITGRTSVDIKLGTEVNLLALVEAVDDVDGTVSAIIKESNLDINTLGKYQVIFEAEDSSKNVGRFTLTVNVVNTDVTDIFAPVISGIANMEITIGSEINLLAFVNAVDDVDGNVVVRIKENNLDVNKIGTYKVVYEANDTAGNIGTLEITIKVVAVEEKTTYTEDFSKLPLSGSTYTKGSFIGNHNIKWEYSGVRGDQPLDDKALTFGGKTDDYSSLKTVLSGGISSISIDFKKAFTSSNLRKIALIINDDIVEEFTLIDNDLVQSFEIELDVYGEYSLEIAQVDTTANRAQITIDNIVIINNPRSTLSLEEQNLNKDFEQLQIQNSFIQVGSIALPTTGVFGSTITWKYTDTTNLNNSFINLTTKEVTLPSTSIVDVKIDAVLVNGEHTSTKTFTIKVGEGDPILISEVFMGVDSQKVKIQGIVTNLFDTANGKKFFIQDNSKGILVYLSSSYTVSVGDEIEIIAERQTASGVIYLNNISKLNKIATKTAPVISLTNQSLDSLEGKLVNLDALLKFTYGSVNTFTLVNEHNEFDIYIDESLQNSSALKSAINGKKVGLEVDLFGVVYKQNGKLKIYITNTSDLKIGTVLNTTRIDSIVHGYLNFPTNGTRLNRNLLLISEDDIFIDLRLEWTSSNTNVLSNQGVIYPGDNEANVVLTYKIYVGDVLISTHNIDIVVEKKSSYSGYYANIQGLTGDSLKLELRSIISKMRSISYTNTSYVLEDADIDLTKTGQLLLVYSRTNVKNKWDGASTWNKEHIWPQSKLGGASKSDIHNLRASNPGVNSSRGNDAFAEGSGDYGRVSGGWYPGDKDKGDIARIVLYMNVRWDLQINSGIGNLQMFLRWHNEDPVDEFEVHRNQVIFQNQENRNPFIDHPELVYMIYGGPKALNIQVEDDITTYKLEFMSIYGVDLLNRKVIGF